MRLFLVRHGSAEDQGGGLDAARALTPEGRREVEDVCGAIAASLQAPVELISSPYLRAEQTAEVLRERLGLSTKIRASDTMLPESDWDGLRAVLVELEAKGAKTVLAIGHNPSISEMVGRAVSTDGTARVAMSKAAVACIDLEDLRKGGSGELRWLISPKALRGAKRG